MNADKRPRTSGNYIPANSNVIVLSDDDGPPRKRQRSLTPKHPVGDTRSAKADTPRVNGVSSAPPTQHEELLKKLPWKNRPSWSHSNSSSTPPDPNSCIFNTSDRASHVINGSAKKHDNSTQHTEDRFRRLSISPVNPRTRYLSEKPTQQHSPYSQLKEAEEERKQILSQFKLAPSTALKFNPNTPAPFDAQNVLSSQPSQLRQQQHVRSEVSAASRSPQPTIELEQLPRNDSTLKPSPSVSISVPVRQSLYVKPLLSSTTPSSKSTKLPVSTSDRPQQLSSFTAPSSKSPKPPILTSDRPQTSPLAFSIKVPLTDRAKFRQERKALQEKLKQGTEYAKAHPDKVERYLGIIGFSNEFASKLNLEEEKFKNAAQPKKRKVDRNKMPLPIPDTTSMQPPLDTHETTKFIHPKDQVKAILVARFSEHVDPPLTFSNNINDRRLDGKFQFISEYILRKGVKAVRTASQLGCTCTGTTGCDSHCACLTKTFKDDKLQDRVELVPQYKRRPDGLVVLRDDFIQRHRIQLTTNSSDTDTDSTTSHQRQSERIEISECNESCPCTPLTCPNRVVQNGRTIPLEIFETLRCGFGVRSSVPLVRGQFIEVYLGEVLTNTDLERREAAAEAGSHSFVYSLDWFSSHQPYHIDGQNFGSAMRFVNHSCEPNAASFPVINHKLGNSKALHYNAFFATRDIPAGTEITIDYTPQAAGETYELRAADEGMEKCYCGSKSCRRMLWLPGKERRSRKKILTKSFD